MWYGNLLRSVKFRDSLRRVHRSIQRAYSLIEIQIQPLSSWSFEDALKCLVYCVFGPRVPSMNAHASHAGRIAVKLAHVISLKTVCSSSHLEWWAEKTNYVMSAGRIVTHGTAQKWLKNETIKKTHLGL